MSCAETVPLPAPQVLLVDDDAGMRAGLETSFTRHGWRVETAAGVIEGIARFRRHPHPLVVTDIRMPDGDGFFLMRQVHTWEPRTAVILLTAFGSVPDAVQAVQAGACDYLEKPVVFEVLERKAQEILARVQGTGPEASELVGQDPAWRKAVERARRAAASDADILIQAESGTGKEMLARMIHRLSPRHERPFVAVNCAAFPESLLESELFGHTRGAFTGATVAKAGKFELADGGTLLLDEIGEMPLSLQPKLLRVLQEREFDRLGDTRPIKVNLRIIATTNRSLEAMVREGRFRADLYYRLLVVPVEVPALRDRRGDIPLLAAHFVQRLARQFGRKVQRISESMLHEMMAYDWPGNIRELENFLARAIVLCPGEALDMKLGVTEGPAEAAAGSLSLENVERKHIESVLASTGWVLEGPKGAAAILRVNPSTLRSRMRRLGIRRPASR